LDNFGELLSGAFLGSASETNFREQISGTALGSSFGLLEQLRGAAMRGAAFDNTTTFGAQF